MSSLKNSVEQFKKEIRNYISRRGFETSRKNVDYSNFGSYVKTYPLSEKTKKKIVLELLIGVGITGIGLKLVMLAILDPEPTSKLALLTIGGFLITTIGISIITSALDQKWHIELSYNKIMVKPLK